MDKTKMKVKDGLILAIHTIYIEKCINKVIKKSLTSYLTKAIKIKRGERKE